jgi:hypothetical protein
MYRDAPARSKLTDQVLENFPELREARRSAKVRNWEPDERKPIRRATGRLALEAKLPFFRRLEQGHEDVHAVSAQRAYVVIQPVASTRTGRDGENPRRIQWNVVNRVDAPGLGMSVTE